MIHAFNDKFKGIMIHCPTRAQVLGQVVNMVVYGSQESPNAGLMKRDDGV